MDVGCAFRKHAERERVSSCSSLVELKPGAHTDHCWKILLDPVDGTCWGIVYLTIPSPLEAF